MTKRQLQKLSDRVTEIESIIDLCSDYDDDILDNLDNELLNIITDMIIDENILNIVNLDIFVKEHGEKYGINNFYVFKSVLRENTYYIKQYLDGVYQNKHRDNE